MRPLKRPQATHAPLSLQSLHESPQGSHRPSLANRPMQERRPQDAAHLQGGMGFRELGW